MLNEDGKNCDGKLLTFLCRIILVIGRQSLESNMLRHGSYILNLGKVGLKFIRQDIYGNSYSTLNNHQSKYDHPPGGPDTFFEIFGVAFPIAN